MDSIGTPELVFIIVLLASTVAIGVLCYVWMKNSRASQRRIEKLHEETVRLLEEQNTLLRRLAESSVTIH